MMSKVLDTPYKFCSDDVSYVRRATILIDRVRQGGGPLDEPR